MEEKHLITSTSGIKGFSAKILVMVCVILIVFIVILVRERKEYTSHFKAPERTESEVLPRTSGSDLPVYRKQPAFSELASSFNAITLVAIGSIVLIVVLSAIVVINLNRTKYMHYRLNNARLDAEKEAKLKEKFLTYMSQEINAPLAGLHEITSKLKGSVPGVQQKNLFELIEKSADSLDLIVDDIIHNSFDYGKLKFNAQPFCLRQVVDEISPGFEKMFLAKRIGFEIRLDRNAGQLLLGDPLRLKQVFYNLIDNALKYTDIGRVTIECRIRIIGERALLKADIADTGIGISDEGLKMLFSEYSRFGDSSFELLHGTGLGLFICRKIIEQQGGKISAVSSVGEGSVFTFEVGFPVICEPAELTREMKSDFDPLLLQKVRLLYVDDNLLNIKLFKSITLRWNLNLDTTTLGSEALEMIAANQYDIIFTDLYMPEINGFELSKIIRNLEDKDKAAVPVIAITASTLYDEADFEIPGITEILEKPFTSVQLLTLILRYSNSVQTEKQL